MLGCSSFTSAARLRCQHPCTSCHPGSTMSLSTSEGHHGSTSLVALLGWAVALWRAAELNTFTALVAQSHRWLRLLQVTNASSSCTQWFPLCLDSSGVGAVSKVVRAKECSALHNTAFKWQYRRIPHTLPVASNGQCGPLASLASASAMLD